MGCKEGGGTISLSPTGAPTPAGRSQWRPQENLVAWRWVQFMRMSVSHLKFLQKADLKSRVHSMEAFVNSEVSRGGQPGAGSTCGT